MSGAGPSRRQFLVGAAIAATTAAVGVGTGVVVGRRAVHQAGVASPPTPEHNGLVTGADLPSAVLGDRGVLRATLAAVGDAAARQGSTVLLGLGPAVVAAIDPRLPAAEPLPAFSQTGSMKGALAATSGRGLLG